MGNPTSTYANGMLITNYDTTKPFIGQNSWADGQVANASGDDVTLPIGTVMGRISSSGLLTPLTSAASNGSQFPVGVLATEYLIPDGETVDVRICTGGEVDASVIKLQGSDTLDTVISSRRIRDRIASDTVGIVLVTVDELSGTDNQ